MFQCAIELNYLLYIGVEEKNGLYRGILLLLILLHIHHLLIFKE